MHLYTVLAGIVFTLTAGTGATLEAESHQINYLYSRAAEADPHNVDPNSDFLLNTLYPREATDPDIEAALHLHFLERESKKTPPNSARGSPRGSLKGSPEGPSSPRSSIQDTNLPFSSPKSAGISSPRGVNTSPPQGKSGTGSSSVRSPRSYGIRPPSANEALPNAQLPMSPKPPRTFEKVRSPPTSPTSPGVKMSIPKQKKARRDIAGWR